MSERSRLLRQVFSSIVILLFTLACSPQRAELQATIVPPPPVPIAWTHVNVNDQFHFFAPTKYGEEKLYEYFDSSTGNLEYDDLTIRFFYGAQSVLFTDCANLPQFKQTAVQIDKRIGTMFSCQAAEPLRPSSLDMPAAYVTGIHFDNVGLDAVGQQERLSFYVYYDDPALQPTAEQIIHLISFPDDMTSQGFLTVDEVYQQCGFGDRVRVRGWQEFHYQQTLLLCQPPSCDCNSTWGELVLLAQNVDLGTVDWDEYYNIPTISISQPSLNCEGNECSMTCLPFDPSSATGFEIVGTVGLDSWGSSNNLALVDVDLNESAQLTGSDQLDTMEVEPIQIGIFTFPLSTEP